MRIWNIEDSLSFRPARGASRMLFILTASPARELTQINGIRVAAG
jgi:hypothetical protein